MLFLPEEILNDFGHSNHSVSPSRTTFPSGLWEF